MSSTSIGPSAKVLRVGLFLTVFGAFLSIAVPSFAEEWVVDPLAASENNGAWGEETVVAVNDVAGESVSEGAGWGDWTVVPAMTEDSVESYSVENIAIPTVVSCVVDSDCSDADACTADVCLNGSCVYPFNTNPCEDGDACTVDDRCQVGSCVSGPQVCMVAPPRPSLSPRRTMCDTRSGEVWCEESQSCIPAEMTCGTSSCPPPGGEICMAGDVIFGPACPPLTVCDTCYTPTQNLCNASKRLTTPGCVANASGNPPYEPCACDAGYVPDGNNGCKPGTNDCGSLGIPACSDAQFVPSCPSLTTCERKSCHVPADGTCTMDERLAMTGCVAGAAGNPAQGEPCACFEGKVPDPTGSSCVSCPTGQVACGRVCVPAGQCCVNGICF